MNKHYDRRIRFEYYSKMSTVSVQNLTRYSEICSYSLLGTRQNSTVYVNIKHKHACNKEQTCGHNAPPRPSLRKLACNRSNGDVCDSFEKEFLYHVLWAQRSCCPSAECARLTACAFLNLWLPKINP